MNNIIISQTLIPEIDKVNFNVENDEIILSINVNDVGGVLNFQYNTVYSNSDDDTLYGGDTSQIYIKRDTKIKIKLSQKSWTFPENNAVVIIGNNPDLYSNLVIQRSDMRSDGFDEACFDARYYDNGEIEMTQKFAINVSLSSEFEAGQSMTLYPQDVTNPKPPKPS